MKKTDITSFQNFTEPFKSIIPRFTETFLTRIITIVFMLLSNIILARYLGPKQFGIFSLAITVATLGVQFGCLGLHSSNIYFISKNRKILPNLIANSLTVSLGVTIVYLLLTIILRKIISPYLPISPLLLGLSLAYIPIGIAYLLLQNILLGINRIDLYNKIELSQKGITLILTITIILSTLGSPEKFLLALLIAVLITLIWLIKYFNSTVNEPPKPSLSLFKAHITYGIKVYLASFLAFLVLKIDLFLINYLLGPTQTGQYSIAVYFSDLLLLIPSVTGALLFPKLSSMNDKNQQWKITKQIAKRIALTTLLCLLIAMVLIKPFLRISFGEQFTPSIPAFLYLSPGIFFLSIEIIIAQYLASLNFPKILISTWLICLIINIILNLWLIPIYGISGAAVASSCSYLIAFLIILIYAYRY